MNERNICKFISAEQAGPISVSCFVFEADTQNINKNPMLRSHRMMLFTKGSGTAVIGGSTLDFSVGTLLFCFKNEKLLFEHTEDCELIYINFDGLRADELFARFNINRQTRVFHDLDGLIPLWKESLSRASEITIDLASESILLYTFSRLFESCAPKNDLVNQIINISEKNFTDPDLSVSMIADKLSYNPKYISHIFKKRMGINYSEYLKSLRIKYAVSLFDNGIDSIKNVALLSGFTDPLYFSTVFKKDIGISPKEYIRSKSK